MIQWSKHYYPISIFYLGVDFRVLHADLLIGLMIGTKINICHILAVIALF